MLQIICFIWNQTLTHKKTTIRVTIRGESLRTLTLKWRRGESKKCCVASFDCNNYCCKFSAILFETLISFRIRPNIVQATLNPCLSKRNNLKNPADLGLMLQDWRTQEVRIFVREEVCFRDASESKKSSLTYGSALKIYEYLTIIFRRETTSTGYICPFE